MVIIIIAAVVVLYALSCVSSIISTIFRIIYDAIDCAESLKSRK